MTAAPAQTREEVDALIERLSKIGEFTWRHNSGLCAAAAAALRAQQEKIARLTDAQVTAEGAYNGVARLLHAAEAERDALRDTLDRAVKLLREIDKHGVLSMATQQGAGIFIRQYDDAARASAPASINAGSASERLICRPGRWR